MARTNSKQQRGRDTSAETSGVAFKPNPREGGQDTKSTRISEVTDKNGYTGKNIGA